jgi:RNA polymerase sigma-70 factor (ECF subfamily)
MSSFRKNYSKLSDEELMSLLTKREQLAFDELYNRYSKPLLNFFFRMLNYDRAKSEDLLNDLFLKIIEKPQNFDKSMKFSSWFYTLAGNMVKNEYRKQQIRTDFRNESNPENTNSVAYNNESLDKDIFNQRLSKELNKVDIDTRTMFDLRFNEEMTIKEIACIFDCPEGTVKSRLFYLIKSLSIKLAVFKPEKI